jgi:hypothetical protein
MHLFLINRESQIFLLNSIFQLRIIEPTKNFYDLREGSSEILRKSFPPLDLVRILGLTIIIRACDISEHLVSRLLLIILMGLSRSRKAIYAPSSPNLPP